jgi:outer membrane receptor protein involved in Fe transport
LSVTGFVNYFGHKLPFDDILNVPPRCYWAQGFNAGSCYAGSPWNPVPSARFQHMLPSVYLFDLALGYNTGDMPANSYLKNLQLQLVVNNVFDKPSPFTYHDRGGDFAAFDMFYGELQRVISITVTKTW